MTAPFERGRRLAELDLARQPLDDGGLADAGVADEERVVLAPPRQHVQRALDLRLPPDERIDLAGPRALVQVDRELRQRIGRRLVGVVVAVVVPVARHAGLGRQELGDPVRDVADHVEPADPLFLQEGDRVRLRLGEERHQHVGAVGLGLPGPEHVVDRALNHARERQRRLRALPIVLRQGLDLLVEEALQLADEAGDRAAAVLDDVAGLLVDHQREQQVLEPGKLVPAVGRVIERVPDRGLQLWAEHAHVSGLFLKDA